MASENEKIDSRYKTLVVPEFQSTIPPRVLAILPESERYLVDMVSKMEQREAWLVAAVTAGNEANVATDIRVTRIEKLVERLTNKWSVIVYLVIMSLPVLLKVLIERWLK